MAYNYIILSKAELEQLLRTAHSSGQNYAIMSLNGLSQVDVDSFINSEIDKVTAVKSSSKHNEVDGWGGC